MEARSACLNCGAPLDGGARQEYCPKCLFLQASAGLLDPGTDPDEDLLTEDSVSPGAPPGSPLGHPEFASTRPAPRAPLPESFSDYELLEEIGHGGMGVVYRARQRSLNRVVAIKMMTLGPSSSPELVQRFRAEAVSAASLHHPHIVAIHEVGIHEGRHFFVMDYVEGPSLVRRVGSQPLPARRAADYLKTIAETVHYAHERGILHRDLKPSNILIDARDQPHVVDFGLARQLEGDSELTVTGQVLGSPQYLPPEQAAGRRGRLSRRTDVYALGATLYHLLTGRPPFQADSLAQTLDLVIHAEPVAPRLLNPGVPRDLETICLKCLEKEPARRYSTAQALAEELARFLAGEPILARPLGPAGKAWRWCRRNPRLAAVTSVALLSVIIGLAGVIWQWRRAEAGQQLALQNAYAADMNLAQHALERGDLGRAVELLDHHRPTRGGPSGIDLRDWEWRYLWQRCQSDERSILHRYEQWPSALALSGDGRFLAARLMYRGIVLWDLASRRQVAEWPSRITTMKAMAFAPLGSLLAAGQEDADGQAFLNLWEVATNQLVARLPHPSTVISVVFSPDGQLLATFAADQKVRLWNVATRQLITHFPASKATDSYAGVLRFSPDGQTLAIGETDGRVRLLDWKTGAEKGLPAPVPGEGVSALVFSPDASLLATGYAPSGTTHASNPDDYGVIHIWNLRTNQELRKLEGHRGGVSALAFTPDGKFLVSASLDQTLKVWDMTGEHEVNTLRGHTHEVWDAVLAADGTTAVSCAKDGSIRF